MSDIKPVLQQNSEIPVIVNKEEFTIELQKYYSGHNKNSKKLEWTSQRIQSVIQLLEEYNTIKSQGKRPTNKHYHHARKYDVMNIGNQKVLIMKRKDISDPVVQKIPTEEYYQKILDAHIATGHGRRDKIVHVLKDKYSVPIFAVSIFLNLCKTCLLKKSLPKKGIVKPLISDDFDRKGQIDLVDFQTCPDQDYKWLLQYQDHRTKFCFLRPLKSKHAKEVAIEVLKIFLEVGCPNILLSDNGIEFTASVLKEIISLWPACKIISPRPRYPQSQGNIEHSNQDIKNMIRAWMVDNNSTNWSIGCYFIQFQKNSSYHSTIAQTPYKALFGEDPKLGLSSTYLSSNIISNLKTEENEKEHFIEIDIKQEQNLEIDHEEEHKNFITINSNIEQTEISTASHEIVNLKQNNIPGNPDLLCENIKKENIILESTAPNKASILPKVGKIFIQEIKNLVCNICSKESSENQKCIKCKKIIHAVCGIVSEENELLCKLCVNECSIIQKRKQSHINLKRAAGKVSTSSKKLKDMSIGSSVLVEIEKVDRGSMDSKI